MKIILIILMTLLISSCKNPRIKPKVMCTVSTTFNTCECRCFDMRRLKATWPSRCNIDSESKSWTWELKECDDITGFYLEDVLTDILPKLKRYK